MDVDTKKIYITVYRDVVAPDSICAMTIRIIVWSIVLTLVLVQSWKERGTQASIAGQG